MSGLPKYTRMPDVETGETDSLVKGGRNSFDEVVPSYPPREGSSSNVVGQNVTYTFCPMYPVKGKTRHVMGRIGTSREVGQVVYSVPIHEHATPERQKNNDR